MSLAAVIGRGGPLVLVAQETLVQILQPRESRAVRNTVSGTMGEGMHRQRVRQRLS